MTITVSLAAPITEIDKRAALRAVNRHNSTRPYNEEGVQDDPLPVATVSELKSSYEMILTEKAVTLHAKESDLTAREDYETNVKSTWRGLTPDQRDQVKTYMAGL